MNNQKRKIHFELRIFHLIFLCIFFIAFFIRLYGAININLTNIEAKDLLTVSAIDLKGISSYFYPLVLKLVLFFGIDGNLALRFLNLIIGSLMVFFPLFFTKDIGKKAAILSSVFIAIDPFSIANSVIFSGNLLTIFFTIILIESLVHRRNNFIQWILILLVFHSRGLGFLILSSALFLMLVILLKRQYFEKIKNSFSENTTKKINYVIIGIFSFVLICISIIIKIPISNLAADISNFVRGWSNNYQPGAYPIVFPFGIFSYIPFVLLICIFFIIGKPKIPFQNTNLLFLWSVLSFLIITINPSHILIDLIWVSLPLCIIAAMTISSYIPLQNYFEKENIIFIGILLVIGFNFCLNIFTLVYRTTWGIDITNPLLSTIFIGIFIIILLIYKAYASTITISLSSFFLAFSLILLIFQFSISTRTAGMNQKPEKEIFWNGYLEDQDIVNKITMTTRNNIFGTAGQLKIYLDGQINPSIVWALQKDNLQFTGDDFKLYEPDVIISSGEVNPEKIGAYQGENYISKSFPEWTLDPLNSVVSTDYWNWLLFRNSQQYKEYNALWLNLTTLSKHSMIGAQ
jgi:hypothetical protein